MTKQDLIEFIDWEGGIADAIQHGLDASEIKSRKLRELWLICVKAYEPFSAACDALERELEKR